MCHSSIGWEVCDRETEIICFFLSLSLSFSISHLFSHFTLNISRQKDREVKIEYWKEFNWIIEWDRFHETVKFQQLNHICRYSSSSSSVFIEATKAKNWNDRFSIDKNPISRKKLVIFGATLTEFWFFCTFCVFFQQHFHTNLLHFLSSKYDHDLPAVTTKINVNTISAPCLSSRRGLLLVILQFVCLIWKGWKNIIIKKRVNMVLIKLGEKFMSQKRTWRQKRIRSRAKNKDDFSRSLIIFGEKRKKYVWFMVYERNWYKA